MDLKSFDKDINNIIYNISYSDEEKIIKWNLLKKKINESKFHPEKFNRILKILNQNNLNKRNIRILDHGCGGCYTIIYLYALGYENVFGVDVDGSYVEINNFFSLMSGKIQKRKILYDGRSLPFKNSCFDFVFSQQVIEHVPFNLQEYFIQEENRVLKSDGVAYHQIPHKLTPYESHIKIWFLHWLPKQLFVLFCKILGKNYKFVRDHLWLKYPWVYLNYLQLHIGKTKNLSLERIKTFHNESMEFFGLSFLMRKSSSLIYRIPFIGNLLSNNLSYFIMLETVSIKMIDLKSKDKIKNVKE